VERSQTSSRPSRSPTRDGLCREEIAAIEVGHTDVSPRTARVMVVAFLAVIIGVPLVQVAHEVSGAGAGGTERRVQCAEVVRILPTGAELRSVDGVTSMVRLSNRMLGDINRFEDDLEEASVLQRALIPPAQWLLTGCLGAGNEKAYCGRGQWLFYRPGIDYVTGRGFLDPAVLEERARSGNEWTPPPQPDPVRAVLHFADQLKARGIDLIIVPAPVKPMIHPERFSARFNGATGVLQNPSFEAFRRRVEAGGVRVFDPAPLLATLKQETGDPVYLATDTHWTPGAMERVTRDLARFVDRSHIPLKPADAAAYQRRPVQVENLGDIAGMLALPAAQAFYEPEHVTVHQVLDGDGRPWTPAEDAEILLLGDSFANVYSLAGMNWGSAAGFAEHLSAALGRPLDRIVINDNGAHATRGALARDLARGIDRLAGKRLVIWEFAARELAVGDWKLIDLELSRRPGPATQTRPTPDGFVVEGTVLAATEAPTPGAVPYKDAVMSLHLGDLTAVNGGPDAESILVYTWVMRDNRLTAAAGFRPGARVRMRLTPWREVRNTFGRYNRREIDDPLVLMLDVYWGEVVRKEGHP